MEETMKPDRKERTTSAKRSRQRIVVSFESEDMGPAENARELMSCRTRTHRLHQLLQ
jgi:hypothetical protein